MVVVGEAIRTNESGIINMKMKSAGMIDGISSEKIRQTGDGNVAEATKRVAGVTVDNGKYVFVRGLGDRYSKTTLNGVDIPGLDPDKNTLQMDIFPTNLINNVVVSKTFTAELPADFTVTANFNASSFFEFEAAVKQLFLINTPLRDPEKETKEAI